MDLRDSYEGLEWSHASVMHNVLTKIARVSRIVQVGVRDFGEGEMDVGIEEGDRVVTFFDDQWAEEMAEGAAFSDLCRRVIEKLPERVYVSFDIDGLDPALCPGTGTPVPGGLSFHHASILLHAVRESGRRVIGFDLVEVAPGNGEWDANVGARVLYKLCGTVRRG
jgi:agmatinase